MTNASGSNASEETEFTIDHKVSCNGDGGALGHPRVYLEMGADDEVTCGYSRAAKPIRPGANCSRHSHGA